MSTEPTDQGHDIDLVFTCSECNSTIRVETVPRVGGSLRCDCGDALAMGAFIEAFPEKWMNPGSFLKRTFKCREGDDEIRVDRIIEHWEAAHDRTLVEEYHSWGQTHACHLCHHVFNLRVNTPGMLLHLDRVHDMRLFEDEFYTELERRPIDAQIPSG